MGTRSGKVYLSDEGYGHIVRQRAIMEALAALDPSLDFTVQTHRHIAAVQRIIPGVKTLDRYNNITWHKQENGSPDIDAIQAEFANYQNTAATWLDVENQSFAHDFVISDFVYEAFELANQHALPAFGVAHFTWDWFFAKLYPPPVQTQVMTYFFEAAKKATRLYFPPFTPEEILRYYKANAQEVPLILGKSNTKKTLESTQKFKVLITDSGAGVLRNTILNALSSVATLNDIEFYVSSNLTCDCSNVKYIDAQELMVDYINQMDLVIGRAGFNTISECIGLRTPMLLIGEAMNPEMNENIVNLKKAGLGSFISLETFENDLGRYLPHFIDHEYKSIAQNMASHDMPVNGAEVIAHDILDRLS